MEENKKITDEILPEVTNIKTSETYTLPSKGLVYNEKDNIPASITLRRMTTKEDKILIRDESEIAIRKNVLQACVTDHNIDIGKLKLMDANYLLFKLRSISLLTDKYRVKCRCNHCDSIFVHELNLSEVPVNYFSEDSLKLFKVRLPISKCEIDLKLPSLDNMIRMTNDLQEYLKNFPSADINETLYTSSAVLYIDKIDGKAKLLEELEDWMDSLDIVDGRAIKDSIKKIDNLYGLSNDIKTLCPNCKKEITHELPITNELFNPSNS